MDAVLLNVGVALAVALVGFGALLAVVSLASWSRLRKTKLLVVGGAFLVLALKGALALAHAWRARDIDLTAVGLDAAVLGFLYASVSMR